MAPTASRELCIMACTFCRRRDFWKCLQELDPRHEPWGESGAREFILAICQIESRNDLDRNPTAAMRFHQLVRGPYLAWRTENTKGILS